MGEGSSPFPLWFLCRIYLVIPLGILRTKFQIVLSNYFIFSDFHNLKNDCVLCIYNLHRINEKLCQIYIHILNYVDLSTKIQLFRRYFEYYRISMWFDGIHR
jgi:hypothetical protein